MPAFDLPLTVDGADDAAFMIELPAALRWTEVADAVRMAAGVPPGTALRCRGSELPPRRGRGAAAVGRYGTSPPVRRQPESAAQVGGPLVVSCVAGPDAGRSLPVLYDPVVIGRGADDHRVVQHRQRTPSAHSTCANRTTTTRVIDPYGIAFHSGRWYVVAHCNLRNDLRTFRLDRFRHHRILESAFERPLDFDALAWLWQSIATMPGTWSVDVLFLCEQWRVEERVAPHMGRIEPHPEGVCVHIPASDLRWMVGYLMSLELPFRILGPDELRANSGRSRSVWRQSQQGEDELGGIRR